MPELAASDSPVRESDYPTLTDGGRAMLRFMREHPSAPIYRNQSGNRLTAEDLEQVRAFEAEVEQAETGWQPGVQPPWLDRFVDRCFADVPHYRGYGTRPADFRDIPTCSRADLGHDIARFVPDPLPLDRLIHFQTSGTSGHPLLIPSHPVVAASYLPFHLKALRRFGIVPSDDGTKVGVVLVGWQLDCFTYTSVTPTMGESGLAKINLHPGDWRDPDDRARYLDALNPEIYTGDPLSFRELLKLPLITRPKALISTSMSLLPGMRRQLEEHFVCPVLDIYSMNEAGPIAVADETAGGHILLQHRLYVEILDAKGRSLPPGERGEVTISGGFNFCLPLLRYRTGDHAALLRKGADMILEGLEGRPPVMFRTMSGSMINNVEVTHALRHIPVAQYSVHQEASGRLMVGISGTDQDSDGVRSALIALFGAGQPVSIFRLENEGAKVVQYTSDLTAEEP